MSSEAFLVCEGARVGMMGALKPLKLSALLSVKSVVVAAVK
jgi:hypothetical protein